MTESSRKTSDRLPHKSPKLSIFTEVAMRSTFHSGLSLDSAGGQTHYTAESLFGCETQTEKT